MKYSELMNKTRSELIELINKFETESNNKSKTIDELRKRLANKHEIEVSLNSRIEQLQTKSLEVLKRTEKNDILVAGFSREIAYLKQLVRDKNVTIGKLEISLNTKQQAIKTLRELSSKLASEHAAKTVTSKLYDNIRVNNINELINDTRISAYMLNNCKDVNATLLEQISANNNALRLQRGNLIHLEKEVEMYKNKCKILNNDIKNLTERLDNATNLPKYATIHITNLEDRNNNLVKTISILEAKLAERNTEILEIKEALRQHGIVICKI